MVISRSPTYPTSSCLVRSLIGTIHKCNPRPYTASEGLISFQDACWREDVALTQYCDNREANG